MVRQSPIEGLWDYLVHEYHYLGHPWIVGSHLKYLVYLEGQVAACLGWGSAAWRVGCRDAFIGWDRQRRKKNLGLVANNVRFLILALGSGKSTWPRRCWLPPPAGLPQIGRPSTGRIWSFLRPLLMWLAFAVPVTGRPTGFMWGETAGVAKHGNRHLRPRAAEGGLPLSPDERLPGAAQWLRLVLFQRI